jgi:hypothetical protein
VRNRTTVIAAVAILALVASACGRKDTDSPFRRVVDRPVQLEVDNNNFLDVTVYAVSGGSSLRIGEVVGKSKGQFTLDPKKVLMTGGLQVLVDPIGSNRTYLSPSVYPYGGATLRLSVAAYIDQSFLSVR